jgi:hypothetical protein
MTNEKRPKLKIKRRPPGLVITPPSPRPVGEDHPARLLFREAIESAKEPAAQPEAPEAPEAVETQVQTDEAAPTSLPPAQTEPLQIFKELREASAVAEEPLETEKEAPPVAEAAALPEVEEPVPQGEVPDSDIEAFEANFGHWRPFLTQAQECVLKALYDMTHAVGVEECMTSMPKLAASAGISERQTYNVVKDLERHGFIERPETFNTPTKKGTIFRLFRSRQTISSAERRYYLGD